jgi:hypothetical protein
MVLIAVFQSLGKMNCFCLVCQTQIILSNRQGWVCLGRVMTSKVGREILGSVHHFGSL